MIYAIIGNCGSGKTLLMTFLAKLDANKGKLIMANYKLSFPYEKLTSAFFRDYTKFPVYEATLCMDELSMYYSARRSASKQNMALRPFILQTRKRALKLYFTAQQWRLVDVNIRENTDGTYFCEMYVKRGEMPWLRKPENWNHKAGDQYILAYRYVNKDGVQKGRGMIIGAERFFRLYNTNEIIMFDEEARKK